MNTCLNMEKNGKRIETKDSIATIVAELLLLQPIRKFPVDPMSLSYPFSVKFDSVENFARRTALTVNKLSQFDDLRDGVTLSYDGGNLILYNHNITSAGRKRFTLAHELGHIFLKHCKDAPEEEREANWFAAELLMPRVLFAKCQERYFNLGASSLAKIFRVSESAVLSRNRQLETAFTASKIEQTLLKSYLPLLPAPDRPIITV